MNDRAEAIDILMRMSTDHFYGHRTMEAFRLGAEALSAERREVQSSECEYWDSESNFCSLHRPSAERRGRWENVEHAPNGLLYVTCSVCGKRQTVETTNYCGNCGALMER